MQSRFALAPALLAATVLVTGVASAQSPDACGAFKWPVARERQLLGASDLSTVETGAALPAIGHGAVLALKPQSEVAYAIAPTRTPKNNPAYGAEVTVSGGVPTAGTIQVTLSDDAWIDVIQNGKVLRSANFSGKEGCQDVRKSVRFAVQPGPVTLAVRDAPHPSLKIAVTAVP